MMSLGRSIFLAGLLMPISVWGHHSVEDTIKELTQKISKSPTPELYFKRAIEYRALRKSKECERDLRAALRLAPDHYSSKMALARLLMTSEKYDEARTYSHEILKSASTLPRMIEARFLSAELAQMRGNRNKALKICEDIQKEFPDHDETIDLFHAYLLIKDEKASEAAQLLQQAYHRTHGVVLRNSWIDASLLAGEIESVWPVIQKELADSRFKAAWLIRRARVAQLQGAREQMQKDLKLALAELETRINSERPDLTLISDRGLALAMKGDKELAKKDLSLLQKSGFPARSFLFLEQQLND